MNCKERLEAFLRENKVPFQVVHHPLAYTAQEVAAAEHVPGRMLAKVVMVFADGKMVMLALPAGSLLFMDGRLWHRQTRNTTADTHYFISNEFSHPMIRAHFDHERVLDPGKFEALPERIRQKLGYDVRLPGNLLEFYEPAHKRRFRQQPIKVLGPDLQSKETD